VRGKISRPMASEAIESTRVNPVVAITTPVTITAAAPSVSEATSRKAPRTFRLSACPRRSSSSDTALAHNAITPNTMSSPELTPTGDISRRIASTRMNAAIPSSSTALAIAARISARA